ncbi:MAG TPA: hypothetical protein VIH59_21190 [Candidatus Tectomicrobia bacterium]|jgi:hypothetical protein
MLLKQSSLGCLVHASYRIVNEATGTAVVVDPQRNLALSLHPTTPHSWRLDSVFLTRFQAKHHNLLPLPAETLIYPAHGAGSLYRKNLWPVFYFYQSGQIDSAKWEQS